MDAVLPIVLTSHFHYVKIPIFTVQRPLSMILTVIDTVLPLTKSYDQKTKKLSKTPNVPFRVSSQEVEYTSIEELHPLLQEVAAQQNVILIGQFKRKLENESRAKKTQSVSPNELLVIDVDKYTLSNHHDVENLPQAFIETLPSYFHNVSFIWQYSASAYVTEDPYILSGHLFFLLDKPMAPNVKKYFLTQLNFNQPFKQQLTLSGTGRNLHYVIDPTLAENSRIVYIAPPNNMPATTPQRPITLSIRSRPTVSLPPDLPGVESINQEKEAVIKQLRTDTGLKNHPKLFATTYNALNDVKVLSHPSEGALTLVDIDDTYIRMNLNNGDSNSYWAYKSNPELVRCFKTDDAFFMSDVDAPFLRTLKELIEQEIQETETDILNSDNGVTDDITKLGPMYQPDDNNMIVFGFYSKRSDSIQSCEYNTSTNSVVMYQHSSTERLEMALADNNRALPDSKEMPNWNPVFNPTDSHIVNFKTHEINSFRPNAVLNTPALTLPASTSTSIGYTNPTDTVKTLAKLCPTIYFALKNGVGTPPREESSIEFEHLLNWISYIIQTRKKTKRAWLLQGTTQSGKSTLVSQIFAPIFSGKHAQLLRFNQITDEFNAELEHLIVMGLDEVKSESKQHTAAMEGMKNLITEPEISVRAMRQNKKTIKSYSNFIMCTNHTDAFNLGTGEESRFNICPWQKHSLKKIANTMPELFSLPPKTTYEEAIAKELPNFVSFTKAYQFDEFAAQTALSNYAKELMIDATRPFPARFCAAVRDGDFRWFVDSMPTVEEIELHQLDPTRLHNKVRALNNGISVLNLITSTTPDQPPKQPRAESSLNQTVGHSVSTKDLHILYTAITADQNVISSKGFHTILNKNNLNYIQTTRNAQRGRFIEGRINWNITPLDIASLIDITSEHATIQPNKDLIAIAV